MDEISRLMKKISITNFEVGSSCWVDITHVSLNNFYVRPRAYNMYLPTLQARGEPMDPYEINFEDIVVYKSKTQKIYVRGKILSKKGEAAEQKFKLYAIDYGCTDENVPLRRIWKPKHESEVPALATICRLADREPPATRYDEYVASLWKYDKGERARIFVKNKTSDGLVVELYNTCPNDIATMLDITGFTTLGYVLCFY